MILAVYINNFLFLCFLSICIIVSYEILKNWMKLDKKSDANLFFICNFGEKQL